MEYKFSIGIPAYKSEFLKECIVSILSQTYQNYELIIVDDCSPSNLGMIVDTFGDHRIQYFKNDNNIGAEHVVDNWNKCLVKATGEFFVLMGDDDLMEPDYLEEFVRIIDLFPTVNVFHCRTKIVNAQSHVIGLTPSCPEFESVYENIWHRINHHRIQYISDFVYRTKPLKNEGGFFKLPLAWASDDISAYIACGNKGIAHTNKPVFKYRQSSFTISNTGNARLKLDAVNLEYEWLNNFLKTVPSTENDKLLHQIIKVNLSGYIQFKKISTIAFDLANKFSIRELLRWYILRKKFGLSRFEILSVILSCIRQIRLKYN